MKTILILSITFISLTALSCKGRDKCGDCPTFSKTEKIDSKSF